MIFEHFRQLQYEDVKEKEFPFFPTLVRKNAIEKWQTIQVV